MNQREVSAGSSPGYHFVSLQETHYDLYFEKAEILRNKYRKSYKSFDLVDDDDLLDKITEQ
jgi:hypothetical protein